MRLAPFIMLGAMLVAMFASLAPAQVLDGPHDAATLAAGQAVVAGACGLRRQGACMSCHGMEGAAQNAAGFPALGGQSAWYLERQLEAYASGARPNAIMQPIAAALSAEQRRQVSAYYAALPVPPPDEERPAGDPALLQHGGVLSAVGSAEIGVQACQNCHGPSGVGIAPLYPRLAGQPDGYIAVQLQAWRAGERPGPPPYDVMTNIARRLSDRDIEAVALYFASVRTADAPPRRTGLLR